MNPPNLESPESQNNNNPNPIPQNTGGAQVVPNSVGALVLGILSIVFCWCYGILAVILGTIGLILANQGEKLYKINPAAYTLASYKNLKAGKICAIIGLCLGALYVIVVIIMFVIFGTLSMNAFSRGFH